MLKLLYLIYHNELYNIARVTSCARGDTMTRYAQPLSSPRGRPSALRAAEQTQRSSSCPRPIRSRSQLHLPQALRPQWVNRPGDLDLWPFDLKSGVPVTCDAGYLCANFSLPRPLCSQVRPDVCDRQTDVRQKHRLMPRLLGGIIRNTKSAVAAPTTLYTILTTIKHRAADNLISVITEK